MSNAIVSNVYRYVIDDVINQVRGEFEDMGIDEAILQELQRSWETKVARSRVANFGFTEENFYDEETDNHTNMNMGSAPDGMSSMQYPSTYNQGAAANLASLATVGTSMRTPIKQEPLTNGVMRQQGYALPPQNAQRPMPQANNNQYPMMPPPMPTSQPLQVQSSTPQQHSQLSQQPSQQPQQTSSNPSSLQNLQLPGSARPNIPQNDGLNDDMTTEQIDAHIADMIMKNEADDEQSTISCSAHWSTGEPIELSSLPDHVQELLRDAKARAIKAGAIRSNTRIPQLDGDAGNDEDEINSDLDDSDDADDDAEGGEEIEHIILCLYDKVTRTKNKWKCILKDGIMLVNGRDYLFHRANGDFEW
ncbi:transcription factor IIA, alpha/beta subunit [Radiomyces spectabilis]|uniref:transcription factor IIA, alpha/beta subunit n=1 Tax=Radiomyces spectabilis TaxID=64574 RepID=UPI00221FA461|nr:transcription factor IIA, alpha/beta subunit [Radiomyces spectabilis]KAI8374604.1 transcription factor IIA, alpha/beta subunit [Radiomyces spectabilis]